MVLIQVISWFLELVYASFNKGGGGGWRVSIFFGDSICFLAELNPLEFSKTLGLVLALNSDVVIFGLKYIQFYSNILNTLIRLEYVFYLTQYK